MKNAILGVNDLATTHPHIMKFWDYKKNTEELGLDPKKLLIGSRKTAYWFCEKCGVSYPQRINYKGYL